ncbi:MAG: hypothetical protein ACRDTM_09310 [Micromonosporaceae bacterium]
MYSLVEASSGGPAKDPQKAVEKLDCEDSQYAHAIIEPGPGMERAGPEEIADRYADGSGLAADFGRLQRKVTYNTGEEAEIVFRDTRGRNVAILQLERGDLGWRLTTVTRCGGA